MKNTILLLTIITLISTGSFSQIKIENFAFMQGNWVGVLEYTDYQDDKSKVQLKTNAFFAQQFDKIVSQYTYVEPDGSLVYDKGQITIAKKGDMINFSGEKLKIIKNTSRQDSSGEGALILEGQGEDNNKKATIRETIYYSKDSLSLLKEVKYEGEKAFLNRHEYRFQRESKEILQKRLLNDLMGSWVLDLRPTPQSDSYLKDFDLTAFEDGKLSGTFYGTAFEGGKIHTDWGKIYFSFTTGDNSGPYFHAGYVENGKIYGTSYSEGRGFMIPWFGEKKKK
jgi:hypothetical protein